MAAPTEPKLVSDLMQSWSDGVNNIVQKDKIKSTMTPAARNCIIDYLGLGQGEPRKRRGMSVLNSTAVASAPAILDIFQFRDLGSIDRTLFVDDDGGLHQIDLSTGTVSDADSGTPTPFTAGTNFISYAQSNNFVIMVNGVENKKFDGGDVWNYGIAAPAAPSAVDSGVAGNPNGTYEFALVAYRSNTGAQSSRSDETSVTVAAKKITVSWTFPADTQVTHVQVAVRKGTLSSDFFIIPSSGVTVTPAPAATHNGYTSATVSITFNATDAELALMQILCPDEEENDPAPVLSLVCEHKGRIFGVPVGEKTKLIFSKDDAPEAFDPSDYRFVGMRDGDPIKGLVSREDGLLILKYHSAYFMTGETPADYAFQKLPWSIGCVSHRSIVAAGGRIAWWSTKGPVVWDGSGTPGQLAWDRIDLSSGAVNKANYDRVWGFEDVDRQLWIWGVPSASASVIDMMLPYNYAADIWVSTGWDPMDISAAAVVLDSNDQEVMLLGNYGGQLFKWWNADNDGIGSGVKEGNVNRDEAGGATVFKLASGVGADALMTTGSGLAQRILILENPQKTVSFRRVITSNTSTEVTVSASVGSAILTTWKWYIGGIDFVFDTYRSTHGEPFLQKRYTFGSVILQADVAAGSVDIAYLLSYAYDPNSYGTLSLSASPSTALWDSAEWDESVWSSGTVEIKRTRVAAVGNAIAVRIRNRQPDVRFTLKAVQVDAEIWTEKSVTS